MEHASIIATLIASRRTIAAFCLPHNQDRYQPPAPVHQALSSRESTPFLDEDTDVPGRSHRLVLTFGKAPKTAREGYVFGLDPRCDVQLGARRDDENTRGVSRKHFSITFDAECRLILRDFSTHGTIVSYDGQAKEEIRTHFTWILFPDFKQIRVMLPKSNISFEIKVEDHTSCSEEYLANVRRALEEQRTDADTVPLHMLDVRSQPTTAAPSGTLSPRSAPIYLLHQELGRGEFGTVYKVVDVSTAKVYAGKSFSGRNKVQREVEIMRRVEHDHIVSFVDFQQRPTPLLVMEYLRLGNLLDQHKKSPIGVEETLAVLVQSLGALAYLHSQGLAHRDIKPANILVSMRAPLSIKLADFGLAKDVGTLETCCGTFFYAAPEIFDGTSYTHAVDIWSLGVVVLEYAYGLPEFRDSRTNMQGWHDKVLSAAEDWESDVLIDLLRDSMLQRQPAKRESAEDCLRVALEIERADQARTQPSIETDPTVKDSSTSAVVPGLEGLQTICELKRYRLTSSPTSQAKSPSSERTQSVREERTFLDKDVIPRESHQSYADNSHRAEQAPSLQRFQKRQRTGKWKVPSPDDVAHTLSPDDVEQLVREAI